MSHLSIISAIRWIFKPAETLKQKALKGGVWVVLDKGVSESTRLLKLVILARLLSPNDFGLMGIALFALGCLETFTETGFNTALTQRQGNIRPYLDTAFTVQALRGTILVGLTYLAAPYIGTFFENPHAIPVIQAIGVVALLRGLTNPATVYFTKELDFKKVFFWNLSEMLTGLAVAIPIAFIYHNTWALVISAIAGQAAKTSVSYLIDPYRPKLTLGWDKVRELGNFGKWVLATNILVFLSLQGDNVVVGKVLGATALGFYSMAFRISELPRTFVAEIICKVAFPLFAQVQEDRETLREAFFRISRVLFSTSVLFTLLLCLFADPIILFMLGEKWTPIVSSLRILALANFVRSLTTLGSWLFYSSDNPHLSFFMTLLRVLVMVVTIYPFSMIWGLRGVAASVFLAICASLPIYFYGIASILKVSHIRHLVGLLPERFQLAGSAKSTPAVR